MTICAYLGFIFVTKRWFSIAGRSQPIKTIVKNVTVFYTGLRSVSVSAKICKCEIDHGMVRGLIRL